MTNQYIGTSQHELVFQRVENGLIKGFDTFTTNELVDGEIVLSQSSCRHSVKLDSGLKLEFGMDAVESIDLPEEVKYARFCDTVSCDVCGACHDSDDSQGYSPNPTWTIQGECSAVCLGCRTADETMVLIERASDLFKARSLRDIQLDGYEEVETLFCDASGLGSAAERALTKSEATHRVQDLLDSSEFPLYAGITDIGQFQVYVTVFKKIA